MSGWKAKAVALFLAVGAHGGVLYLASQALPEAQAQAAVRHGLGVSQTWTAAQNHAAPVWSTVGSGVTAFGCVTTGCKVDLGAGASDYIQSDNGNGIITPGTITTTSRVTSDALWGYNGTGVTIKGGGGTYDNFITDNNGAALTSGRIAVFKNSSEKASVDANGRYISSEGLRLNTAGGGSKPSCESATRGLVWYVQGGGAVADTFEVCTKDAADSYAWRSVY